MPHRPPHRPPLRPSRRLRRGIAPFALALPLLVFTLLPTGAQAPAPGSPPVTAPGFSALEELTRSVVGVSAEVPADARTAPALGTRREGSGIVIDRLGRVITIGYVILEAERVRLTRHDGQAFPARVLGYDADSGLGLLQALAPLEVEPLPLGSAHGLAERDPVLMISRRGSEAVESVTVVSRRTFTGYWEYLLEEAIYTAPAQGDYAGAALLDKELRLVGVGSLYVQNSLADDAEVPGNLFVPIDRLSPVLEDLVRQGRPGGPARPWLGINVAEQFGRVIVTRVTPQGPADQAGVHPGDLILEVGGHKLRGLEHFYRRLWALGEAGVTVKLRLLQRNDLVALSVHSQDRYAHYRLAPRR